MRREDRAVIATGPLKEKMSRPYSALKNFIRQDKN
jgi:hypothetical protein